ncbi:unnamed protein product, partial [Ectocarpus sp. 13 AM-2016]
MPGVARCRTIELPCRVGFCNFLVNARSKIGGVYTELSAPVGRKKLSKMLSSGRLAGNSFTFIRAHTVKQCRRTTNRARLDAPLMCAMLSQGSSFLRHNRCRFRRPRVMLGSCRTR